jgi:PilZ domain-containing protein
MDRRDNTLGSALRQERKFRRFELRYPVHLRFHSGGEVVFEVDAVSKNVSVGGLLADVPLLIPQHTSVSFVLILRGLPILRPIVLSGEGEVVRVELGGPEAGFGIAVKYTNRITQFESFLSPTA